MLIDVIVTKSFAGLEVGKITQLQESAFNDLFDKGYVKKLEADKTSVKTVNENKKGFKK
jgi:hypothetical protein